MPQNDFRVTVPLTFGRTLLGASYAGFQAHTVVAGDTLFGIAQKVYGDGNLWPRLFTANRDIISDPNLIRVALENLLGNAWKFTSKRERARIEFGKNDGAYFVRDNGAGFDPAYKAKLFGAFQRLHHATDFSGTGIGLATVQRIVRRHGGQIWAEGEPDKGAAFHFTLHPG